jgi:hypothetical protein
MRVMGFRQQLFGWRRSDECIKRKAKFCCRFAAGAATKDRRHNVRLWLTSPRKGSCLGLRWSKFPQKR